MPVTGGSEFWPAILYDNGGAWVNAKHPDYNGGAVGDGVANDTSALNLAIATGKNVLVPAGTYLADNLTQTTNQQIIASPGGAIIKKRANGALFTSSGNNVTLHNLWFRGESSTPAFTGDNIVSSGADFALYNCGSRWAFGRALKATGQHLQLYGSGDIYQTTDATATGYDVEIGVSGTATLYHEIHGLYTSQATGGILATDVGSLHLVGGQIGKFRIKAGTSPAGVNGGITLGVRILGAVTVEISDAVFCANQFNNVPITLAAGTSGITIDESNAFASGSTVTNNGNQTANLIRRRVSTGASGTVQIKIGDDTTYYIEEYTLAASGLGEFRASSMRVPNNRTIALERASAAVGATLSMSAADNLGMVNSVTDKAITFSTTGTGPGSLVQVDIGGTVRHKVDVNGVTLPNAGDGFSIKEGTNAKMGAATLVAGTVVVSTTKVTANSRIFLQGQNSSGTHGELTISARTAGTSFTITSGSGTDTRLVGWEIKEPAP